MNLSYEMLFTFSNLVVMPFWLLMIFLPHWKFTKRVLSSPLIALPTALLYVALVLPQAFSLAGSLSNPSLAGITRLLSTSEAVLIAWAHFLTFDLLTGRWAFLESRAQNFNAWLMAPILFLILMLGPLGFVLYLILRYAYFIGRQRNGAPSSIATAGMF